MPSFFVFLLSFSSEWTLRHSSLTERLTIIICSIIRPCRRALSRVMSATQPLRRFGAGGTGTRAAGRLAVGEARMGVTV